MVGANRMDSFHHGDMHSSSFELGLLPTRIPNRTPSTPKPKRTKRKRTDLVFELDGFGSFLEHFFTKSWFGGAGVTTYVYRSNSVRCRLARARGQTCGQPELSKHPARQNPLGRLHSPPLLLQSNHWTRGGHSESNQGNIYSREW